MLIRKVLYDSFSRFGNELPKTLIVRASGTFINYFTCPICCITGKPEVEGEGPMLGRAFCGSGMLGGRLVCLVDGILLGLFDVSGKKV